MCTSSTRCPGWGRYADVEALARPVLAGTDDPELVGRVTWALAYALRLLGEFERALAVTGDALAGRALSARWAARLRALHSSMLCTLGRFDEARSAAEQAEAEGLRAGDRVAVGWALFASAVLARHHRDELARMSLLERAEAVVGDDPEAMDLRLLVAV